MLAVARPEGEGAADPSGRRSRSEAATRRTGVDGTGTAGVADVAAGTAAGAAVGEPAPSEVPSIAARAVSARPSVVSTLSVPSVTCALLARYSPASPVRAAGASAPRPGTGTGITCRALATRVAITSSGPSPG